MTTGAERAHSLSSRSTEWKRADYFDSWAVSGSIALAIRMAIASSARVRTAGSDDIRSRRNHSGVSRYEAGDLLLEAVHLRGKASLYQSRNDRRAEQPPPRGRAGAIVEHVARANLQRSPPIKSLFNRDLRPRAAISRDRRVGAPDRAWGQNNVL